MQTGQPFEKPLVLPLWQGCAHRPASRLQQWRCFKNKVTAILALLHSCEWALEKNQGLLFCEARHSRQVISHFWDCQRERRVIWGMEMNHRARFLPPTTSYCALRIKKKLACDPSDRTLSVMRTASPHYIMVSREEVWHISVDRVHDAQDVSG